MASEDGQRGESGAGQREARPDLTKLHHRAQVALVDTISPDETLLAVIHGLSGSAIICTDRRALVFKTGARAGAPFGYRLKPFEYESILRVDVHRGAGTDVVVIHAPLKIGSCSSYWADERDDPWKARNAIPVGLPDRGVEEGAARLAELVTEFQEEHARAGQRRAQSAPPKEPEGWAFGGRRDQAGRKRRSVTPGVAAGPSMEDCPKCGARLRMRWQFCPRCGTPAGSDRHADERRRSSSG